MCCPLQMWRTSACTCAVSGYPHCSITLDVLDACHLLQVYRKPVVGVLSTGDELVEPGEQKLGPGQIRDANRLMLASAASTSGCEVVDLGIARDTVEDVSSSRLLSDILISIGCSSHLQALFSAHMLGQIMEANRHLAVLLPAPVAARS